MIISISEVTVRLIKCTSELTINNSKVIPSGYKHFKSNCSTTEVIISISEVTKHLGVIICISEVTVSTSDGFCTSTSNA